MGVRETGGKVVFLRTVVEGGASKSYGIEVARLAGLPGSVLRRAREVLRRLETEGAPRPGVVCVDAAQLPLRLEDGGPPTLLPDDVTPDGPSVESEVLAALRDAPLDETTPLQALQLLARLQKDLTRDDERLASGHGAPVPRDVRVSVALLTTGEGGLQGPSPRRLSFRSRSRSPVETRRPALAGWNTDRSGRERVLEVVVPRLWDGGSSSSSGPRDDAAEARRSARPTPGGGAPTADRRGGRPRICRAKESPRVRMAVVVNATAWPWPSVCSRAATLAASIRRSSRPGRAQGLLHPGEGPRAPEARDSWLTVAHRSSGREEVPEESTRAGLVFTAAQLLSDLSRDQPPGRGRDGLDGRRPGAARACPRSPLADDAALALAQAYLDASGRTPRARSFSRLQHPRSCVSLVPPGYGHFVLGEASCFAEGIRAVQDRERYHGNANDVMASSSRHIAEVCGSCSTNRKAKIIKMN